MRAAFEEHQESNAGVCSPGLFSSPVFHIFAFDSPDIILRQATVFIKRSVILRLW